MSEISNKRKAAYYIGICLIINCSNLVRQVIVK
jgi:hypothetical protein